jgi:hypothetical protein
MVTCGFCGHPGEHATITTTYGGVKYCTGCPYCQDELARRRQQADASPGGEEGPPDSGGGGAR